MSVKCPATAATLFLPVLVVQSNIEAASTVDAFLKDAKEKEASLAADLEAGVSSHDENVHTKVTASAARAQRLSSSSSAVAMKTVSRASAQPMVDSPTRARLPASEARSKLLGHAKLESQLAPHKRQDGWQ